VADTEPITDEELAAIEIGDARYGDDLRLVAEVRTLRAEVERLRSLLDRLPNQAIQVFDLQR
jgi:hypothetical protein